MTTPAPLAPIVPSGDYISLPISSTAADLQAKAFAFLAQSMPEWVPRDGHLEVWLLEALSQMVAEAATVAASVPLSIFQYFGQSLVGVPPLPGAAATLTSTWTLSDNAGHVIPAGTRVAYLPTNRSPAVIYTVASDTTIPAGSSASTVGGVPLVAQQPGVGGNAAPVGALQVVDNLAYVQAISAATAAQGGVDVESATAYLNRLTVALRLLSPRPILPSDFAALARSQPGVARAVAVDGYNPVDSTSGNARMVAVACVDALGNPLTAAQSTAVGTALQAQREVNFVVNVIGPTYTTINITAQVTAFRAASVNAVSAACTAALNAYLSKANWGGPAPAWVSSPTVRYTAIVAVLGNVPGVQYVGQVQLSTGATAPSASADLTLAGAAGLPAIGAINVTVAAGTG
jgi:uncharacterized phage protein gp47/JayE